MSNFYYTNTPFAESVKVWSGGDKEKAFCVIYFKDTGRMVVSVDGNLKDKETRIKFYPGNPAFNALKVLKQTFVDYNLNQGFFGGVGSAPTGNSIYFLEKPDSYVEVVFGNNPDDKENANKIFFNSKNYKFATAGEAFRSFLKDMKKVAEREEKGEEKSKER